ncbi:DUF4913 domain-containing protein [Embleya sp. NBC_00888]|uniref:DUF4913 domain-containing protein n=1 Tax=Embleya sp. NBC_00888 TaxID=2975960 RepID=UPI003866B4C5|nr:DUF4913 domain-containing protein [Embleya sp. NBC_00888]
MTEQHNGVNPARLAEDVDEPDEDNAAAAPTFILFLDEDTAEYRAELVALDQWVRLVLVTYLRDVNSAAPWCDEWFRHPEAVARLHALWLAWQQYTAPEAGGWDGPSVWHRDHLDPCMHQLRSADGPFNACGTNVARIRHRAPGMYDAVPFAPLPFTADDLNEP